MAPSLDGARTRSVKRQPSPDSRSTRSSRAATTTWRCSPTALCGRGATTPSAKPMRLRASSALSTSPRVRTTREHAALMAASRYGVVTSKASAILPLIWAALRSWPSAARTPSRAVPTDRFSAGVSTTSDSARFLTRSATSSPSPLAATTRLDFGPTEWSWPGVQACLVRHLFRSA